MRRSVAMVLALEAGVGCALASVVFTRFIVWAGSDFAVYYAGARALRLDPGANIYQWPVIQAHMSPTGACWLIQSPFVYPPLLAILLEPLTLLPCSAAFYVWDIVSALLLSGALYLLSEIWTPRLGTFALLCAATLMSFPLLMGLYYAQVHTLILFGLVLALWRYQRGDWLGAGVALACVAWIQVIPGLFVLYFLLRREWRVLASLLGSGAVLLVGMLLLLGPGWLPEYLHSIGHAYAINQSTGNASLVYRLGLWFGLVVLAVYAGLIWRYRGNQTVGFLWTVASFILVSPIAWSYFLLWLFPVLLLWWRRGTPWLRALTIVLYLALYFTKQFIVVQMAIIVVIWLLLGWEYVRAATSAVPPLAAPDSTAHEAHAPITAQPVPNTTG